LNDWTTSGILRQNAYMDAYLVLNGPNLNLLGQREPDRYGLTTLPEIHAHMQQLAQHYGVQITCFQSNHEGQLIDRIQAAKPEGITGIIINPGALSHTSVAIRDALAAVQIPFVEVHLTNIAARESFRHFSYLSGLAEGTITGLGVQGYILALLSFIHKDHPLWI
jgi:3-dehydroquinate dehydratase-2